MSDKTEREYRQNMLTILNRFYRGRGASLLTKDEREALYYAISSIKTDLKYDLLYEETKHIADADKIIESTTKNDLGVELISKSDVDRIIDCPYFRQADKLIQIMNLPSVTSQEPRRGHWIKVTNGRGGHECDLCHEYAPSYQSGDEHLSEFCPDCGAKMVEPQESEG